MGRIARTALPNGSFHVYTRGIAGGSPIFVDDADRRFFLVLLVRCAERYRWSCRAYTLLSTHYHLVLEATRANLSAGIHQLKGRYADHVNRRHSSFGHVFAERFQAPRDRERGTSTKRVRMLLRIRSPPASATRPEDWPWSYRRDAA